MTAESESRYYEGERAVDWRRVFDLKGLNWWVVLSGMGMNFVLTSFLMLWIASSTSTEGEVAGSALITLVMMGGGFFIPLLTAYVCGRLSDERFLTYAAYSLVGYLIPVMPGILASGGMGFLMLAFGFLGAFNGATLSARRVMKRQRQIREMLSDQDNGVKRET
jgi:hypothetical protein